MFGYVVANLKELSEQQQLRYRSCYCGVCRALRQRGGLKSSLALRYDLVFLALLLSSLYEPEEQTVQRRCPTHPVRQVSQLENRFLRYSADMGLLLAYHKAQDDWQDDRSAAALAARGLLQRGVRRIGAEYPRQSGAVQSRLSALTQLEREQSRNLDALCGSFGALLGEIFVPREQDFWAGALRRLGDALGRYLYLLDCCLDLEQDRQKNCFNPLLGDALRESSSWQQSALAMLLGETAAAFEHLPLLQDEQLLRNIVYSGLPAALPDHLRSFLEDQTE